MSTHPHHGVRSAPSTAECDASIVVPVYGGAQTLPTLLERIALMAAESKLGVEVLLICDRPRDNSWEVACALVEQYPFARSALLMRNFGQHPATLLGIRMARGDIIVTMDEDLQHDPADIPSLVAAARAQRGIAYGKATTLQHSWWRNFSSRSAKWFLARYVGLDYASDLSAFRAFASELRDAFDQYRSERVAIDVLLSWSGAPIQIVPCQHAARQEGHSGYTLRKLVAYLMDLLLGFSIAPLRLSSLIGLGAVALSISIILFVLLRWLIEGSTVPGFAFLALSVSTFAGIQLLALGVIGEYLGRLYFNSLNRPQYLVQEIREHHPPSR
ncbi:MAG: glycosyltransferase [Myxococcota bacterium]